ncbi:C-type mannose receptor 2-like [Micropterus salmoides]|uniref:C-type mannose receptor 2-like n=1 Tax=Micropterus salmoides TaxID=27706 RepID=UPI0018EC3555|nr:C-type mannose receptor 2-like [Micropterus salmoides]
MDYGVIIIVLTGALVNVASAQTRQYYFESTPLNWTEAQSFCRQVYTDLATVETISDVSTVLSTTPRYTGKAWIGLYDHSWKWSLSNSSFYGEADTGFRNWAPGHPVSPNGQHNCVLLLNNYYFSYYYNYHNFLGTWMDMNCNNQYFSVCYNGSVNGASSFVKVNKYLNWTDAQRYCRENYVDLASIQNQAENDVITKLAASDFVWIGLHWEQVWSDGSTSLFQNWDGGQPDCTGQCVTTVFSDIGRWSEDSCSLTFPFICYSTSVQGVPCLAPDVSWDWPLRPCTQDKWLMMDGWYMSYEMNAEMWLGVRCDTTFLP